MANITDTQAARLAVLWGSWVLAPGVRTLLAPETPGPVELPEHHCLWAVQRGPVVDAHYLAEAGGPRGAPFAAGNAAQAAGAVIDVSAYPMNAWPAGWQKCASSHRIGRWRPYDPQSVVWKSAMRWLYLAAVIAEEHGWTDPVSRLMFDGMPADRAVLTGILTCDVVVPRIGPCERS